MTRTCSECPCLDRERKYGRIFWCRRRECYVPPQMDACGYRKVFEPLRDEVRRLRRELNDEREMFGAFAQVLRRAEEKGGSHARDND